MASNTSASTTPSLSDLIERNVVNGVNVMLSIPGILGNLLVVFLIAKNANLRKHCKYLQAALAAGDAVLCLGQLTNATTNLIVANLAPKIIRWQCLLLSTHGAVAIMYSMIMTVFIAFDRFYAIVAPLRYRVLPKKRTCLYCVTAALGTSLAFAVVSYTDVNLYDYPSGCIGSSSRSAAMSGLINNFNAIAGIIILIVYPLTLAAMSYKTGRLMKNMMLQNNDTQYFMKQVNVTSSITCVVAAGLFLYVIPNMLVIILKSYNAQPIITSKAPAYIGLGSTIHSGINCLFYIWKDVNMREAFLKLFPCLARGAVTQAPAAPSSTGQPQNR